MGGSVQSRLIVRLPINPPPMNDDTSPQLTPLLCLTASLLYMIQSDGRIDDHESSQIQSVLGGQEDILALGLDYVAATPIEEFLSTAAPLLSQKDIWCILTNVFDSLLSDSVATEEEKNLFQTICQAFEVTAQDFATCEYALRFKNNKRKLGNYSLETLTSPFPPAHLSLAACLLYMMAADGDIAEEEIGQLQVVIGEFEGLQEVAMQQVRCMKLSPFLRNATPYLNTDQRIFILVNVYDSMLSDGVVKDKEQILFETMQDAFAITGQQLAPYLKAIDYKNHKPKLTQIDKDAIHIRQQRQAEQTDEWDQPLHSSEAGELVQRTMDHNIQQVSDGFHGQEDIDLVSLNANNLDQRIKLQEEMLTPNIQQIDLDGSSRNLQPVDEGHATDNRQPLPDDHVTTPEPQFFAHARMDSLQMNVTQVHRQLDLITPRSTWQTLDAFFKQRPIVIEHDELMVNAQQLGEIDIPQRLDTLSAPAKDMAFATADIDGDIDGGIRLRSLLLVIGVSLPLVGFAYGLIYPTMVCQGPSHQWQQWTPDDDAEASRVINDQTTTERHLIQIRRGEIHVANQRFPLYKELNQSNHFAQQTERGFKGTYSTHTVDQMTYVFNFFRDPDQLHVETQSAGIRYIDGQSGHIEVFSVFKGQCENRWF